MSEVLTKELIAYWRAEAEKYGAPADLSTQLPSGGDMPKELWLKLLYAAEVGLAMDEKMLHLLNRFGIAVEALEKIETAATLALNLNPTSYIGKVCGSVAREALRKLELPE